MLLSMRCCLLPPSALISNGTDSPPSLRNTFRLIGSPRQICNGSDGERGLGDEFIEPMLEVFERYESRNMDHRQMG